MSKAILITGATGKQGGSVVRALLAHPSFSPTKYSIYAVTRNIDSPSAKRLASSSPAIKLVSGDMNDTPSIFRSLPSKPWGVFSVQLPGKEEVPQGKALIDAAVNAGTSHFVFTSVDRQGDASGSNPTDVPHFTTKHEIEQHLVQKSKDSKDKMSYTILRPVFFLDNLEWDYFGKVITTAWRDKVHRKLQVIATTDIGYFGACAFLDNENRVYHNAAISLAGDELTFEEADKIMREKTGKPIPTTWNFLPTILFWLSKDMAKMFNFFNEQGFGADVQRLRTMNEGLQNFSMWVEQSSFAKTK